MRCVKSACFSGLPRHNRRITLSSQKTNSPDEILQPQPESDAQRAVHARCALVRAGHQAPGSPHPHTLIFDQRRSAHADLRGMRTPSDSLRGRFALRRQHARVRPTSHAHGVPCRERFRAGVVCASRPCRRHLCMRPSSAASVANVRAMRHGRGSRRRGFPLEGGLRRVHRVVARCIRNAAAPRCSARVKGWSVVKTPAHRHCRLATAGNTKNRADAIGPVRTPCGTE